MDLGLAGKKALVTGATKGIGRAVAEALLAEGASVAICARNGADVDRALDELSAAGTAVGSLWTLEISGRSKPGSRRRPRRWAASTSTSTTPRARVSASSTTGPRTSTSI